MNEPNTYRGPARTAARTASLYAFALILSLFFLWGLANNLNDILIKQFKKAFTLSDFGAGLVQSAFYAGYFLFAVPASLSTRRFGYKATLVMGLLLYAIGAFLFYPAASLRTYGLFLTALFIIASGLAFLETAANPLVTILGPEASAARRLNLAQSFNPLGSITGILVGQIFIFSRAELSPDQLAGMTTSAQAEYYAAQSTAVQIPYLVIGAVVLLWAFLVATVRMPSENVPRPPIASGAGVRSLLRNRNYLFSVLAQFFYVGAQVSVWSYLIRYAQQTLPGLSERHAAHYLTASLVLFMVGRFSGTALMRVLSPERLLALFASSALVLVSVSLLFPGPLGVGALVMASFFMSIHFPTIFALGLRGLDGEERKTAASFLVMAIVGGAVLTLATGAISDSLGIHRAMLVPIACFAVVRLFAGYHRKLTAAI